MNRRLVSAIGCVGLIVTGVVLYRRTPDVEPTPFAPTPDFVLNMNHEPVTVETRLGTLTLTVSGSYLVEKMAGATTLNVHASGFVLPDGIENEFHDATDGHFTLYNMPKSRAFGESDIIGQINAGTTDYEAYLRHLNGETPETTRLPVNKGYYKHTVAPDPEQIAQILRDIIGAPTLEQHVQHASTKAYGCALQLTDKARGLVHSLQPQR